MCGCGGSSASARQAPREAVRQRQTGSQQQRRARPSISFTDDGFTWTGPQRPAPKPAEPARR